MLLAGRMPVGGIVPLRVGMVEQRTVAGGLQQQEQQVGDDTQRPEKGFLGGGERSACG